LISGIGKAGNPDIMDGVTEGMVVGVCTYDDDDTDDNVDDNVDNDDNDDKDDFYGWGNRGHGRWGMYI
jgi:hypothetical protein